VILIEYSLAGTSRSAKTRIHLKNVVTLRFPYLSLLISRKTPHGQAPMAFGDRNRPKCAESTSLGVKKGRRSDRLTSRFCRIFQKFLKPNRLPNPGRIDFAEDDFCNARTAMNRSATRVCISVPAQSGLRNFQTAAGRPEKNRRHRSLRAKAKQIPFETVRT